MHAFYGMRIVLYKCGGYLLELFHEYMNLEILDSCNHKTNVMGTLNMLGLAKRIGARFLLTSTSEVYGDPLEHPQKETYWGHVNPIGRLITFFYLLLHCFIICVFSLFGFSMFIMLKFLDELGVRSCYDEGKRVAETLTMDYHRGDGVEV